MKTPVTQVLTMLTIFQLFEYQSESLTKPVATCLMTFLCEDNIKTWRGDPLSTTLSIDIADINVACAASIICQVDKDNMQDTIQL